MKTRAASRRFIRSEVTRIVILSNHVRLACAWGLFALLVSEIAGAQQQPFRRYGQTEGLSNLNVRCLFEDRIGYIWVGTDNGLFRYDGASFKEFNHADGLPSTEIEGLAESPNGILWVTTQDGVVRSAGSGFQSVDVDEKGTFSTVAVDSLGRVLLQNASGILRGTPDGAGSYRFHRIVHGATHSLLIHGTDVFFGKDDGLWQLKGDQAVQVGSSAGLPSDRWAAISLDSLGNLWVRSATRLYELHPRQTRFVDRGEGIPHAPDPSLYADHRGNLYVSTPEGLMVLEGSAVTVMDSHHGLPSDTVSVALVDREDSLWIGTGGGGLIRRLGHGEWSSWKKADGLLHEAIWAIRGDRKGQTWVGTYGGLNILDAKGTVVRSLTRRNGLAGDQVSTIVEGLGGHFFVGTNSVGISYFDSHGTLLRTYRSKSGYTPDRLLAMLFDEKHRLWAMGRDGCFRSRAPVDARGDVTFERVAIPGMPTETWFRTAVLDEAGVVWVGTSNGLARFDGKSWRIFTQKDGLKSSDLSAVASVHNEVWLAYRDALGMTRLRFARNFMDVKHYTMQDGLASNLAYALAFDQTGRLWANTDRGVAVLDHGHWLHYGSADGLVWDDTNGVSLNVDAENDVWIGTSGGLSRYTALPYPIPNNPTPVVLTSIKSEVREWQPDDRVMLSYSKRSLFIQYAGLSFSPESRVRFRYRLLGLESTWTDTGERSVRFAALPAGSYTFEVVAQGSSNVWSTAPAHFSFVILPPWWQTWWFIATCLLAALLASYALWHLRVRALTNQKRVLEHQVASRTAELIESQRHLQEIAYCDMLTSLPNRRSFSDELHNRIRLAGLNGNTFAMLMFDLDHFKRINDTFGHDAGDLVLLETAARLRVAVRKLDYVARLGGDEFAVLLAAGDDKEGIENVCSRILHSFAAPIPFREEDLEVGCSIGVAVFPDDCMTAEELYKAADRALYEAKRNGKNRFCWHAIIPS